MYTFELGASIFPIIDHSNTLSLVQTLGPLSEPVDSPESQFDLLLILVAQRTNAHALTYTPTYLSSLSLSRYAASLERVPSHIWLVSDVHTSTLTEQSKDVSTFRG